MQEGEKSRLQLHSKFEAQANETLPKKDTRTFPTFKHLGKWGFECDGKTYITNFEIHLAYFLPVPITVDT